AGARFDVYSHHPYPRWFGRGRPETPLQTLPCTRWLTMASLQCLLQGVSKNFGPKHVWLTEYGYKTNPPDRYRGVSPALQARCLAVGPVSVTGNEGFFTRQVSAGGGSRFRVWSLLDDTFSPALVVR